VPSRGRSNQSRSRLPCTGTNDAVAATRMNDEDVVIPPFIGYNEKPQRSGEWKRTSETVIGGTI